jgi:phosphatidate cytidylyltransferase
MKNFLTRILFVAAAVPILFALALYIPAFNHVPIALIIFAFTAGGAVELTRMLEPKARALRAVQAATLGTIPPAAVYVAGLASPSSGLAATWLAPVSAAVMAAFLLSAIPLAFYKTSESISASAGRAAANGLYLIYPGALASAIVALLSVPGVAGRLVIWFALIAFGNDSLAWLAGVTIGRRRGIFVMSPNKSLEGLIAGLAGSLGFALAGPFMFPGVVPRNWALLTALGLACGAAVVVGDLFESALKRSAGVKDSGSIIPGRGGILDSFDSLLFAAPVFTLLLSATGVIAL